METWALAKNAFTSEMEFSAGFLLGAPLLFGLGYFSSVWLQEASVWRLASGLLGLVAISFVLIALSSVFDGIDAKIDGAKAPRIEAFVIAIATVSGRYLLDLLVILVSYASGRFLASSRQISIEDRGAK